MTELQQKLADIAAARDSVYANNITDKTVRAMLLGLYEALSILAGPVGGDGGEDDGAEGGDVSATTDTAPKGRRKAKVAA